VDVYTHVFLTPALVRGDWSASRPDRFTPDIHWTGGLTQSRCGRRGEHNYCYSTGTRTRSISSFLSFRFAGECTNCVDDGVTLASNRWTMPLLKLGEKRYYLGIFFKVRNQLLVLLRLL
jgi:hypothetical protein